MVNGRLEYRKILKNTSFISYGTMHFSKGLEFKSVAAMACDEDVLPQQERLERVTDGSDLAEVYETEAHLLYVACTSSQRASAYNWYCSGQ